MMRLILLRLREIMSHENNALLATAVVVGTVTGAAAVGLVWAFRAVAVVLLGGEGPTTSTPWRVAIAPIAGALVAGPLIAWGAREAKGHGVPQVMEAVALKGGRIRGRVAVVKTLASAFTIGSGGSGGREGPIVQIGSALGSLVARLFRVSEDRSRLLVACGAAAGISAAFNAPLAGVFFALEVILQRFTTRGFATVVVSAVTASVVWRAVFGNRPVLDVPLFGLRHPAELLIYLVLGFAAALVGVVFVRVLYSAEDLFDALPIPEALKPAIGGALLGGLGVGVVIFIGQPIVYGTGLYGIDQALAGQYVWFGMLLLVAAKILATSFSLGSGGSGGVFAPALFMGAMLGGAIGHGATALFPTIAASPGAYATVGMGAVFAGAAQAPISAILILFEMTNDYRIILPLMLSCIVATTAYSFLQKDSIYTMKLRRKGIELSQGRERHLLERTPVSHAIVEDLVALRLPVDGQDVQERIAKQGQDVLVCVDEFARYIGMLPLERVTDELVDGSDLLALLDTDVKPVVATESLDDAFALMAPRGLRVLPVVDSLVFKRVIGIVTRESLASAYWTAVATSRQVSST
ncbi:MAG: chloride channel protein [Actinomycetota bacterium]